MSTHVLDHLVHLTPPGTVEQASAAFRKLGFDVLPGGTHADGQTYNALVVLADGVYIELIAFVHPNTPPSSHRWAAAAPGWIAYAHLGLVPDVAGVINGRAARDGSGAAYDEGVDGGRTTPRGRRLEWRVTFPRATRHGVGRLPFFCGDVTPREWRVPEAGNHPAGVRGVSYVKVLAAGAEEFTTLTAQLSTVLGVPPDTSAGPGGGVVSWTLDTPAPLPGLRTQLILEETREEAGKSSGIDEVGFWVAGGKGGDAGSPYGRIVWTPLPADA